MNIEEYLKNYNGSDFLNEKIEKIKKIADQICPEEIIDLHISEYKKPNRERVDESLYFFSKKFMMESKKLISENFDLDILFYEDYIDWYNINAIDFDFEKSNNSSILKIEGKIGDNVFIIKATEKNCENLWRIVKTYIQPNIYQELEIITEKRDEE